MENAVKNEMKIPNKVDYESGNNWGEMKKVIIEDR